jgi:hypothetical protein
MRTPLWAAWAAAALFLAVGLTAPADEKKPAGDMAKADLDAFRAYLAKHYPGKKWQLGPTRIDTPEIRKAYGKRRFYYIFSAPPLPSGVYNKWAAPEEARKAWEFQKSHLSLTVAITEGEKIRPLLGAADFNTGLMKVQSADDVKTAAAAIMALYGSFRIGPGPVSADQVTATRSGKGWSARVSGKGFLSFQGTVTFDAGGKCTSMWKLYTGPFPE